MAKRRRKQYEFKPDVTRATWIKKIHLTQLQQRILLKWALYGLLCVLLVVIQDVIMSRVRIFGATTELVAAAILIITVSEDAEDGSIFALVASMLYVFTGSAPGPYTIAFLTFLGVAAAMFRQLYWRRGFSSNVLCAGVALMIYELCVFGAGVFTGLTYWQRVGIFLLTGAYSWIVMAALYPLMSLIRKIGGETWKE